MDKKQSMSGMDVVKKIAQRAKEVLLKPRDTFVPGVGMGFRFLG